VRWLSLALWFGFGLAACDSPSPPEPGADADAVAPPAETSLRAAAATVDITPAPGVEIIGYGRRESTAVRDPLHGGVLVLAAGPDVVAIVTLDLPGVFEWHVQLIRARVASILGTTPERVVVAASHTHSAPMLGDDAWSRDTMEALARAAMEAKAALTPAWLGFGESEIAFCVNRRLPVDGEVRAAPNPDGPVDPRVRVLRLARPGGEAIATVTHAVCHPNLLLGVESTVISADFPGEARRRLNAPWLFLTGAAGDVRPDTVDEAGEFRLGNDDDLRMAGRMLADATEAAETTPIPVIDDPLASASARLTLTRRDGAPMTIELSAHRVDGVLLLTIPGEPFVEIALEVERQLGRNVVVVGYANGYADYIVTADQEPLGGYEVERSLLPASATAEIVSALVELGRAVMR